MNSINIGLLPTGKANLASIRASFARLGQSLYLLSSPAQLEEMDALILPGVGAFDAAMETLNQGWVPRIREHWRRQKPLLAICLGMHLLFEASEEGERPGLGFFQGTVTHLPVSQRVPQMGWNEVLSWIEPNLVPAGAYYFANSYGVTQSPDGWLSYQYEHGATFVAALERESVLACQFHPELSDSLGRLVLQRWVNQAVDWKETSCSNVV